MTYRIKQIGSSYYPQRLHFLFFWCNFTGQYGFDVVFDNLEAAKNFLTVSHVERKVIKAKEKVVIHKFKMWER